MMNSLAWAQRADDKGVPVDILETQHLFGKTGPEDLSTALILSDWSETLTEMKARTLAVYPLLEGIPVLSVPVGDAMMVALLEASPTNLQKLACSLKEGGDTLCLTLRKAENAVTLLFNTNQPKILEALLQWWGLSYIPIIVRHRVDSDLVNSGLVRLPFPEGLADFFAMSASRLSGFELNHVVLAMHYAESQKGHDLPTKTQLRLVTEATTWHQTQIALAMYQVFTGRG